MQIKMLFEPQPLLAQADPLALAYNEVVEDFYLEELARGHYLLGDADVFGGGGGVAAGVVVGYDDGGGVDSHGLFEDLGYTDEGRVEGASVNVYVFYDLIFRVKEDYAQGFLVEGAELEHEEWGEVGWGAHLEALFGLGEEEAAAHFEGRF